MVADTGMSTEEDGAPPWQSLVSVPDAHRFGSLHTPSFAYLQLFAP